MSEGNKKALEGLDPNATIQIDQVGGLDQVELLDEAAPLSPAPSGARQAPPALPSGVPTVPPSAGAGRPGSGRTIARAVLVCAVVIAAMAAGLLVGSRMRGGASAAPAAPAAPAASGAPPTAPAAASASTLVLPTVEIGRH